MNARTNSEAMLRVPLALNRDGEPILVGMAMRGTAHFCHSCRARLTLRDGKRRRTHFAHAAGGACAGENAQHFQAKRQIADANTCPSCGATQGDSYVHGRRGANSAFAQWPPSLPSDGRCRRGS